MWPSKSWSMKGRCAVVTGGASGIGRALVAELARAGAKVGILDMDGAAAAALAEELRQRGHDALGLACDVREAKQCEAAIDEVARSFGGVELLVNNAGITHRSLFRDTSTDVIRRVMDVNFFGAVHCTKAALPHLLDRRGMVVAVSSIAGVAPLLGRTGYSASKHALHGFFDSLRAEVEPQGVSVLLVCPSFTRTALQDRALDGRGAHADAPRSIVGREWNPEDVAAAMMKGITSRQRLLVLSPVGVITYWLSRVLPSAYERLMRRQVERDFQPPKSP
jgi:NAD(P)-dependent dehydrogenase (short-subunit alcohol dehydrogenase family)